MTADSISSMSNAPLKVINWAVKPINGGPARKPRKPTVVTAARAMLAGIVFDLPALL